MAQRGNFLVGVAVGIGAALFGPALWRNGRPAVKKAMRAGVEGYTVARQAAARFAEDIEDMVAEVSHEIKVAANAGEPGDDIIEATGGAIEPKTTH